MSNSDGASYAPGWYPDVHVPGTERYYDGAQWTAQVRASGPAAPGAPSTVAATTPPKKKGRGWLIAGAVVLGVIVVSSIANALGGGASDDEPTADDAAPAAEEVVAEPAPAAEEEAAEPVAEPEPAPVEEAPADQGDAANPLPQPYTAQGLLGGDKYTLTGRVVDADANAAVAGYNMFNTEAPAGFKYVVVELSMTGIDPDGVEPSLANVDLSLATPEGNLYSSEYIVFGDGMPSMSEGPTLYPGSTFTGYTAYIVPESAQTFLIHDNGKYISF